MPNWPLNTDIVCHRRVYREPFRYKEVQRLAEVTAHTSLEAIDNHEAKM
ncbi:hypothetical protein SHPE106448_16280 [Shewanella pealeana]